jgi:uncharacterized membrane protein
MTKKTALSALLGAVTLAALVAPVHAEDAKPATERCYGVAKAGKNDCGTASHGCANQAEKDNMASEWVKVPAGLCAKLAGGSTTAPAK